MSTLPKKLRAYYNLHKKAFSVQERVGKSWKVVRHAYGLCLTDATFRVSEAGRQRVLRERRKNVHAYITGTESDQGTDYPATEVSYNPYRGTQFTDRSGNTVTTARRVSLVILQNKPVIFCNT